MAFLPCPDCGYDGWLTVTEAAERVQKSDSTIRQWIENGRLPAQRETIPGGHRYLIRVEDLDALGGQAA